VYENIKIKIIDQNQQFSTNVRGLIKRNTIKHNIAIQYGIDNNHYHMDILTTIVRNSKDIWYESGYKLGTYKMQGSSGSHYITKFNIK
jgi:hypothetical protein